MTLEQLAGRAGRSKAWLSKIENGRLPLEKRGDIAALAEALEVSADALLGEPAPVQRLEPLGQIGDLANGVDDVGRQQGARGERKCGKRTPLVLSQGADAEPVQDLRVADCLPGKRPEGMPALAHQRRALPEMQRLAIHRGHQASHLGDFLGRERPSQVAGDQGERALVRQPVQLTGIAAAAQNRLGRADHQAAAGQDLEQVAKLIGADTQIVDGDNGADLPEQLAALLLGQLDRPIAGIQPGHEIL